MLNVTKSLIMEGFFQGGRGGGCKAIWRIVHTSEKILVTPLDFRRRISTLVGRILFEEPEFLNL